MKPFTFSRPADIPSAVAAAAADPEAVFLGGGTNLVDHLKLGVAQPSQVIDVRTVTSDEVTDGDDGGLVIGAAVTNSELAADRRVRERYPVLARALLAGASGQLRNMATTGGNPLQRTRCVYFQDTSAACNKRNPASGCDAVGGYTRHHAILGVATDPDAGAAQTCIATHPSDMAVALRVLDARFRVLGPDGSRVIAAAELHRLPGEDPARDSTLEHGELITAIELPPLPEGARSTYRKVRDRASYAFALVSVAAAVTVTDGVMEDVRIALGGVAHIPWRATHAEAALRGQAPGAASFTEAAAAELAGAHPQPGIDGGNAFKVALASRTLVATLHELTRGEWT